MLRKSHERVQAFCVFILVQMALLSHSGAEEKKTLPLEGAILQTTIHAEALKSPSFQTPGKVLPKTPMKLTAIVKSIGDVPNAPGKIFLRFSLPKPLDEQPGSVLFATESIDLPSLEPGKEIAISFSTPHEWPSVFDFIRDDWSMRAYEAVVMIKGDEYITGMRNISFSTYYYEGSASEQPIKVSSADYIPRPKR